MWRKTVLLIVISGAHHQGCFLLCNFQDHKLCMQPKLQAARAGPTLLEEGFGRHRNTVLAAFLFTTACLLSLCLYWCMQRCVYRYMADIMKAEMADSGARYVEDFFHELARNMFPRAHIATACKLSQHAHVCVLYACTGNLSSHFGTCERSARRHHPCVGTICAR